MPDVFISFVHEEASIALAVRDLLIERLDLPHRVFMSEDRGQIFAGDEWLKKIRGSLAEAKVLVLLLSKRATARPWVNFEAGAAWLSGTPIIPCCFGNMSKGRLPHPYSSIQALDLPTDTDYLLASVHHHLHLDGPAPTSDSLTNAVEFDAGSVSSSSPIQLRVECGPYLRLKQSLEQHVDIEATLVVKRVAGKPIPSPGPEELDTTDVSFDDDGLELSGPVGET